MRKLLQLISWSALVATILPALLFLAGRVELLQVKQVMLLATAVWFVTTPLWMGKSQ